MADPLLTGISICKSSLKTRFLHSDQSPVDSGCEIGKVVPSTDFSGYSVYQDLAPILRLKKFW
jgi:hypothetical protein